MTLAAKLAVAFVVIATVSAVDGLAQTAPTVPGDQNFGVNFIFFETQAEEVDFVRFRIERAGYSDVSVLERDSWGVWRGRARKGDTLVNVVVDKGGRIKMEPAR